MARGGESVIVLPSPERTASAWKRSRQTVASVAVRKVPVADCHTQRCASSLASHSTALARLSLPMWRKHALLPVGRRSIRLEPEAATYRGDKETERPEGI